ncbi:LIMLP_04285 family protein [Leptospira andrefontaineae]|uniref:Uncharacterized protein n=1 Tax=Leptospira andrefontaineae TaxID=2484976 RepID=A0A4R9HA76_9LEPT|nr:hypothetical protein [Leptospira andrefontaineae]TGK43418.1 hypothetical protein EHO65_01880 [Leptospira andrefontaineae]
MITRTIITISIFLICLGTLSADTVTNTKTKEVIENVKTTQTEQGVIVEFEDGSRRGFDRTVVTVEAKPVEWKQKEQESYPDKERYKDYGIFGAIFLVVLLLP